MKQPEQQQEAVEEVVALVRPTGVVAGQAFAYLWRLWPLLKYWLHWQVWALQFSILPFFSPCLEHRAESSVEFWASSQLQPWVDCHLVSSWYCQSTFFEFVTLPFTWLQLPWQQLLWHQVYLSPVPGQAFVSSLLMCQLRFHLEAWNQILHDY